MLSPLTGLKFESEIFFKTTFKFTFLLNKILNSYDKNIGHVDSIKKSRM